MKPLLVKNYLNKISKPNTKFIFKIDELLRANDELNNTFLRYERFEKSIQNQNTESKTQDLKENFGTKDEKPLIDFNDETGLSSSQAKKQVENNSSINYFVSNRKVKYNTKLLFKIDLDSYLSNMKLSENKKKDSREDDVSSFFIHVIWFEINE